MPFCFASLVHPIPNARGYTRASRTAGRICAPPILDAGKLPVAVLSRPFNRYLEVLVSLCCSRTISLRKTKRHHPGCHTHSMLQLILTDSGNDG